MKARNHATKPDKIQLLLGFMMCLVCSCASTPQGLTPAEQAAAEEAAEMRRQAELRRQELAAEQERLEQEAEAARLAVEQAAAELQVARDKARDEERTRRAARIEELQAEIARVQAETANVEAASILLQHAIEKAEFLRQQFEREIDLALSLNNSETTTTFVNNEEISALLTEVEQLRAKAAELTSQMSE
jgi:uncharacterized phage infection (PIP) family protein YhgE